MERGTGRLTDELVQRLLWSGLCTGLLCWRENWTKRWGSLFTGPSLFQPSPMVTNYEQWPREWDHEYKQLKWAFSVGWLDSPLEIGWGDQSFVRESRSSCCSFTLRGASWGGSGIWLGCPLESSLVRCFRHVQLGGDHEADPGHTGKTPPFSWPGSALVFSGEGGWR